MNTKNIQNRINLKELFSKATDKNFYNLFQPVIPKIDLTGKIAQVISAVTEAVTVWLICKSKLSEVNQIVAVLVSIGAVILLVTAIEIGGRKGLEVITRAVVWKKLQNFWYWILFLFIVAITGFLFWQSFKLSTKGVNQAFLQSVETAIIFDDGEYLKRYRVLKSEINIKFDNQKKTLTDAFILNYDAKEKEYNSQIEVVNASIEVHSNNMDKGVKWAKSHFNKQTKIKNELVALKDAKLSELTTVHTKDLKTVEATRIEALNIEAAKHKEALKKAENALNQNHTSEKNQAAFWGDLFSNLVGFMIGIAFVCIVVVEIFRRGSGIEIDYQEDELPPTLFNIFLSGLNNRTFNLSYNLAKKWYVEKREFSFFTQDIAPRRIGFQFSTNTSNEAYNDLPNTLLSQDEQNNFGDTFCSNTNCQNKFFKRSHNHRFCSTDCRVGEWERDTGQTLRKKKSTK